MPPISVTITINGKPCAAQTGETILEVCKREGIDIPYLCYFEGLCNIGACRLCVVELEGFPKLLPACTTPVAAKQNIRTESEKLKQYRKMIIELFFSERNHICAVCVANGNCELQALAQRYNVDHVRFPYLYPECGVDTSHQYFVMDHNRCVLCRRCVRVCRDIEGAHVWDVMGRGSNARVISGFNQPWAEVDRCTSCSKCVQVCPTGALWSKDSFLGTLEKKPDMVSKLAAARKINA